jgi:hypothetical protein
MKAMNIKRRAIEVWMSDHKTQVWVKAPTMQQFREYLDSFGVVQRIGEAFQAVSPENSLPTNFMQVKIPQADLDGFYPLLAALSTSRELTLPLGARQSTDLTDADYTGPAKPITVEEFNNLQVDDGMGILWAYVKLLAPDTLVNPTNAGTGTEPAPQATPEPVVQPS